jgi:hypothetical protein
MLTGIIVFIILILFFVFFIIHKRDMLSKMFSLNASFPAGELQEQLERTADTVIRRLETQIAHLELLLDEADTKMAILDEKLNAADIVIRQNEELSLPLQPTPPAIDLRLPAEYPLTPQQVIAEFTEDNVAPKEVKDGLNGDKRRIILAMAEQGYNVTEIAKSTGVGKGEIMLLLQLNRK